MNPNDIRSIFEQMASGGMGGFTTMPSVTRTYRIKILLGDSEIQSKTLETNERNALHQWIQICYQIAQDTRPVKAIMEYDYYKWDGSVLHVDSAEYQNLKYVKWLNEK